MVKDSIKNLIYLSSYCFNRNTDSKVVYYHDVDRKYTDMGIDYDDFVGHIKVLRKAGFEFVPRITEPQKQLRMCFDDGWAGIYDHRQLFVDEKIVPTIFIAVDLIGKEGYMTEDQIKELINLGFIFESHTWSHRDLTEFTEKQLEHELEDAKNELNRLFGLPFDELCFPLGRFSDLIYNKSIEAGYKLLYTSVDGGGFFDFIDQKLVCRNFMQSVSPRFVKYYIMGFSKLLFNRAISQHFEGNACRYFYK